MTTSSCNMLDLAKSFAELDLPAHPGCITTQPDGDAQWRVGKTADGDAAILYRLDEMRTSGDAYDLKHLRYRPSIAARIEVDGRKREGFFAVVTCRAEDRRMTAHFLRLMASLLRQPETVESPRAFDECIGNLVKLFRAIGRPGRGSLQGIWAELAMIVWARDPKHALAAWHSLPEETVDFRSGSLRLEVKSSTRSVREHEVSLGQLVVEDGGNTLIASLLLTADDDGPSINDLVDRIHARVKMAGESQRLEAIVADSIGADWREAETLRFDEAGARESLALFNSAMVPSVSRDIPAEVSCVRFVTDLSGTPPLPLDEARDLAPFYGDVLPDELKPR